MLELGQPVSLFRNGRNQAIRIPRKYELEGTHAILRKKEGCLIIEPFSPHNKLLELLATWEPLEESIPDCTDLPPLSEDMF